MRDSRAGLTRAAHRFLRHLRLAAASCPYRRPLLLQLLLLGRRALVLLAAGALAGERHA